MFCEIRMLYIIFHRDRFPKAILRVIQFFFHQIDVIFDVNGMLPTDQTQTAAGSRGMEQHDNRVCSAFVRALFSSKQSDLRPSCCLACAMINGNAEHNETLGDLFKLERNLQSVTADS